MKTILFWLTEKRDNYIDFLATIVLCSMLANGKFFEGLIVFVIMSVLADYAHYWVNKKYP